MSYIDTSIRPTSLAFTEDYSDGSGVQYGVSFTSKHGEEISIESCGVISFPLEKLDWFIDRLKRMKEELNQ